jgi:enterochelin esterase-like enzyme
MKVFFILLVLALAIGCKNVKEKDDDLYSRHLQRHVRLTVINTPIPEDKSTLNLLILNDGQDMEKFRVKEILDSLFRKHLIAPLVIVGVHAGDKIQEYGVADKPDYQKRGSRAEFYDAFIHDELYPYAKKMSSVRKFNTVAIAGCSEGGLSAFDIAWNHPDKIQKVGVFSGSFWWRDKALEDSTYSDEINRIAYAKIKSSRKKPKLEFWFYAGGAEETSDRDKDSIIDVIDDTRDIITLLENKKIADPQDIRYKEIREGKHEYSSWAAILPDFLIWAFGNK